jgi:hypothetical protein
MDDNKVEIFAKHFIECFKIRADEFVGKEENSFNEAITEDATDMLFGPSFREDVQEMTNQQYNKYLRTVLEEARKTVKHHDPKDSPVETPESEGDSYLGIATNS